MNPIKFFTTPEYLFRPRQALIRLRRAVCQPPGDRAWVTLPWGARLRVRPKEVIGANLWYYGIFDLIVAEAIARLVDPGETALDIGANIGQMTSLMSCRVGSQGVVESFEPHPEVFAELQENLASWRGHDSWGLVRLHQMALSDQSGQGALTLNAQWDGNRGTARVRAAGGGGADTTVAVWLETLDAVMGPERSAGVCKIDVEGHEEQVFRGAQRLLARRGIRDIIFEDLGEFPGPVHRLLLDHGYRLFTLWTRVTRPVLQPAGKSASIPTTRDGSNYLATLDPGRAQARFGGGGWRALRSRA